MPMVERSLQGSFDYFAARFANGNSAQGDMRYGSVV